MVTDVGVDIATASGSVVSVCSDSDYIQEGEFLFLRSLLVSNQVVWITQRNGENIALPVNLDDTTYTERKTRDGKLYNLSLKVRMANEYWT